MKHNIIAQFSCSVYSDKDTAQSRIPSGKVQGDFKDYQVVNGSEFNEEFSETLDSAVIVLSQISKEDRLINLRSYDYVRVFDKSTYNSSTGEYGFDKLYLVDNFDEVENNIHEHIFGYTINLMSETKLLEKIQCPNLTITHAVEDGATQKKTIYEHIKQYMELYVPKIKFSSDGTSWKYEPLIKLPENDFYTENANTDHIEDRSFVQQGDEWETTAFFAWSNVSDIDIQDVDKDTITVTNIEDEGNIPFYDISVTFDSSRNGFNLVAIVKEEPESNWEGTIYFEFSFYSIYNDLSRKFSNPCADLSFNMPTLRQLLTILMQQVSCIPIVKNRTLSFLDFKQLAVPFGGNNGYDVNNTVNRITRGLSSDSFANTLVNISENVLDSGNEVYSETLGFRDLEHALLKQQENLFLETKFPIYKVNFFRINAYVKSNVGISNIRGTQTVGVPGYSETVSWGINITKPSNDTVMIWFGLTIGEHGKIIVHGDLVGFDFNNEKTDTFSIHEIYYGSSFTPGSDDKITFSSSYGMFYFNGYISVSDRDNISSTYKYIVFVSNFHSFPELLTLYSQDITPLLLENSIRQNLSTNFVAMDNEITSNPTIATLAKYVYGTVGYSIGSKKIEGFSQVFTKGESTWLGWISADYTYIENIWNFITTHYKDRIGQKIKEEFGNLPVVYDYTYQDGNVVPSTGNNSNFSINNISAFNPWKELWEQESVSNLFSWTTTLLSTDFNFCYMWFDITYMPLNSFNLSYSKTIEEIDFPIAQLDSNNSGLTDFDRLSIHEQEQVDRIGNEVLTINQRTSDYNDIQDFSNGPLFFKEDSNRDGDIDGEDNKINYIIFKRSFSINNNCFNASYIGSKDAILKDYFTSIRTKYRAYQYVDYNQSVLRKERDTFFVKISEKGWYNGDDKVFFGEFTFGTAFNTQRSRLSWLIPHYSSSSSHYIFEDSYNTLAKNPSGETTKNDLSKISYDNFISFVYEECDNAGSGTYIGDNAYEQLIASVIKRGWNVDSNTNLGYLWGGVSQEWQLWENDFYVAHQIGFYSQLNINDSFDTYPEFDISNQQSVDDILNSLKNVLSLPKVNSRLYEGKTIFSIVKNNSNINDYENRKRVFYKDFSERINHTVQFVYYTDSSNILWTEGFFKPNNSETYLHSESSTSHPLVRKVFDLSNKDFEINREMYLSDESTVNIDFMSIVYCTRANSNPYIQVDWNSLPSGMTQFKIVEEVFNSGRKYYRDILAFKKGSEDIQKFYITLNDTKSDYVMSERNGILFRRYKVRQNTSDRLVDKIYDL